MLFDIVSSVEDQPCACVGYGMVVQGPWVGLKNINCLYHGT